MTLKLLAVAQQELDDAVAWYNVQVHGLGDAFLIEALKAFRLIEQHPIAWQPLTANIRRCRLSRFPYGVLYTIEAVDVLVLAIAHLHRAPLFWQNRLPK